MTAQSQVREWLGITGDTPEDIVKYIDGMKHVSFAELEKAFPVYFGGNTALCYPNPTIIIWTGFTDEGYNVFNSLISEKRVYLHGCKTFLGGVPLVYLTDGKILRFPLAKSIRVYKKERWLPCVLNTFPIRVNV